MATSRAKKRRRDAVNASLEELEKEQTQLPPNDNRYMVLSDWIALMMSRSQLRRHGSWRA